MGRVWPPMTETSGSGSKGQTVAGCGGKAWNSPEGSGGHQKSRHVMGENTEVVEARPGAGYVCIR